MSPMLDAALVRLVTALTVLVERALVEIEKR